MKKKGFTLIELLVVIAIIGILTGIILANLDKARSKSRDSRRIADISQIQLALALYLNKYGHYPEGDSNTLPAELVTNNNFLPEMPTDPLSGDSIHEYGYQSYTADPTDPNDTHTGGMYCLSAVLENPSTYVDPSLTNTNCPTAYSNPANIPANQVYIVTK